MPNGITAYRIDYGGEISFAPKGEGACVHVIQAPDDHERVIAALRSACAIPLPVTGRYVVGWHKLEGAIVDGRRIIATRFE